MTDALQSELGKLRAALAGLEAQRAVLGEAIVAPAIDSLREKIAALDRREREATEPSPAEERRIVTILFTDIAGSTALAEKLDPEDWREIVAAIHGMAGRLIQRHHGSVVQYLGDGLLALFGAQTPSERDPENAIRAALDIQTMMDASREGGSMKEVSAFIPHHLPSLRSGGGSSLRLRIGIHTGLVVVGEMGSEAKRELTATGDAMNLAARLQSAAPPGGVLISHDTLRYVRGIFDVTPQPPLAVKGKREPIQTYVTLRARPRSFRTVTRGVAGVETRTIGRAAELGRLQAACARAIEERALVWAQIVGQPGMGKSRLLSEMTEYGALRPEDVGLLKGRAFEGDEKQAFGLIRRLWFDRFLIAEDTPLAEAEARWVERFLRFRGGGDAEAAHALGLLVGLPFVDSPHIGAMRNDPAQVKGRAIVVSREFLASLRQRMHVVILFEDLHWADTSSWEYLTQVVLEAEAAPRGLFVLATTRPGWNPPRALVDHPGYVQIDLESLSDSACRELVMELLQRVEGVPDDVIHHIAQRSEGVPYFAEEIVNWFMDRGIIEQSSQPWRLDLARLNESPLPATLQHLLLTRLSSLNEAERAALQRGSIFGRNFWEGGLQALGLPDGPDTLPRLQPRNFVDAQTESSLSGEREWSFHHALLREVTYESVLKRERPGLHKTAAEWLETHARSANRLDEFASILAEHAERAGETNAAADWYLRAGDRARSQGAVREARRFYDRALALATPEDRERRWRALLGLNSALSILGEDEAQRASVPLLLELAQELDDSRLAEALYRSSLYLDKTGDLRAALTQYQAALEAARRANNPQIEIKILASQVICQNRLGDLKCAATAQQAIALASRVDEATAARALSNVAVYYVEAGDLARAAQLHKEQAAIDHRLGDRGSQANALLNLGYDYALLGLYSSARAALEQALPMLQAIGARREGAYALLNLGLVHWRCGDVHAAREALAQAQIDLSGTGDTFGSAAELSYSALVLEQSGAVEDAQRRFERARELFIGMGVRGYAADAAAGLARCALAQHNPDAARRYASEVWDYLAQGGAQGMEFPIKAFLTCAEVFDALGEADKSRTAIEEGYGELIKRAEKISNIEWGKFFLAHVPEHRALLELWERVADVTAIRSKTLSPQGG